MRVAIILVNWNSWRFTCACIDTLLKLHTKHEVSVIVLDNASVDESRKKLGAYGDSIVLLSQNSNLGFTGANNIGIQHAIKYLNSDYIWILNNDTTVKSDALDALIDAADQKPGIYGSKIYFSPGYEYHKQRYSKSEQGKVLWYTGGIIDWDNVYASHRGVDEVDTGKYDHIEQTQFVTGCSMFMSTKIIDEVGMFDEAYYLYFEDVDLCLRAQKKGFKSYIVPESVVWHKNASSSGGSGSSLHQYYQMRNRYLIGLRYANLRTKFALLRNALQLSLRGKNIEKKASRDALLGRYGKALT